jgi:hypothetical protein
MTPAEAVWLLDRGGRCCTQGMVVFTAGGKMLGTGGGYTAEPNIKMLKDALSKYKPEESVEIGDPTTPVANEEIPPGWRHLPRVIPRPAKDGLVLYVTWKPVGLPEKPQKLRENLTLKDYQLGRRQLLVDRLWASKAEADTLAAGHLPEKMKQRLAAFVGPILCSKVQSMDLTLREQRLSGSFRLETGERCEALGFVEAKDGKVCRFELIVKGRVTGKADISGFASLGTLLPDGEKTSAVVAFMLADSKDELAKVQPGSKDLGGGEEKEPLASKPAR